MNHSEIIEHVQIYANVRARFLKLCQAVQERIEKAKRDNLGSLLAHGVAVAREEKLLREAIASNPKLFEKPRTYTEAGIKFGMAKKPGKLTWTDEEEVVHRIKLFAPDGDHGGLLHVKYTPNKEALEKLSGAELKKLGITVGEDSDAVVIKPENTDLEKLAKSFLTEEEAE